MNKVKADLAALTKDREAVLKEKESLAKEKEHLLKNCAKYKEDLAKEAAFRQQMEETWNTRGTEYRTHVETLQATLQTNDDKLEKISVAFLKFKEESRIQLKKLTLDREKIVKELKRLQHENDNLVGKHSSLAEAMNNEVINLPDGLEEMQLLLLQYREDLITAKVGKERAEEKLASEVGFLKQQLTGELQARTTIQHQYSTQLQGLEEKIMHLEPAHQYLEAETNKRKELEEKLAQIQSLQNEARLEAIKNLEAARSQKESAEAQISQLKSKVFGLQTDLDNSVAVQNDFVRLSQNLQMELEKIRQSEKEVRWQHEEDVTECNNCKTGVQPKSKKKDNCRHCGRIFCQDCLQKKVSSGGSGRMAPVCDVCHTLLVQNSAPYFASETPNQM
jgi:Rab GTPase-binding effector protein 1